MDSSLPANAGSISQQTRDKELGISTPVLAGAGALPGHERVAELPQRGRRALTAGREPLNWDQSPALHSPHLRWGQLRTSSGTSKLPVSVSDFMMLSFHHCTIETTERRG